MDVSRRQFFKICAGGMAGTTVAALGFAPKQALAQARNYKLLRAKEIRNTCTYCSVGCGLLMYSLGDGAKNAREAIYHIEGDPDHPVSRGALCPKGAGLLDYVNSENRLRYPEYRAPGSDKWQRISWEEAFSRIAKLMKADRDANFIEKNEQGVTVNRWLSTGMLCASGASNETGMLTQKFARSLFVSLMKSFYGDAAQKENNWGYDWLPKWDQTYDVIKYFNMMDEGKVTGYFCQGFNPVASFPDKNKVVSCLSKLKYMVVIDPLVTETSTFWQNHGESNDVDPASIQTEVFRLPSTCFAEEDGSIANSGRWLQWHWKGQDAPGEARNDGEILAGIYHHLRELYQAEGGKGVEPLMKMSWNYKQPHEPQSDEVAKENNGYALEDLYDANGVLIAKKGQLLSSFAHLRDDGTTASSCWIYTGSWTEQGNQMANRDNSDPSGLGNTLGWAWAWPLNRRVLYNRASADINGKPWDPKRMLIQWNGSKWTGNDIPDFGNAAPGTPTGPFIMQPEGMGRLFAINKMAEGPFPEHYEPIETPLGTNPLHPNVVSNPVVRLYEQDALRMGKKEQFPYVGTTYRLTEHFHTWTKHALLNAIAQPEQFVEISETLAAAKGIANGDRVTVSSKRGFIRAVAVVTRRLKPLNVNGQQVETVGIPIHWGFEGVARKGYIANTLTPNVGDANSQTPEYKAFLVNIEKA